MVLKTDDVGVGRGDGLSPTDAWHGSAERFGHDGFVLGGGVGKVGTADGTADLLGSRKQWRSVLSAVLSTSGLRACVHAEQAEQPVDRVARAAVLVGDDAVDGLGMVFEHRCLPERSRGGMPRVELAQACTLVADLDVVRVPNCARFRRPPR